MIQDGVLSYADRLFLAGLHTPASKPVAQKAVQKAARLLSLALGQSLGELRESRDPLMQAHASGREQSVIARVLADVADLLGSRLDKLPERRRPHYTPHQRWRILEVRRLLALSAEETAALFRVSKGTVLRWEAEVASEPDKDTVGSLLKPVPPVRRYADVVRHLVQTMDRLGFRGAGTIAAILARAGWRLARETVRRYRHQPPVSPSPEAPGRMPPSESPLQARRPNDVWLVDLTHVQSLFGLRSFVLAAVLDAFSRAPLALRVFPREPTPQAMADLVRSALRRHGRPRSLVSDRGPQFTAWSFGRFLQRFHIQHRFGAIGRSGSIALIERFWRTLKDTLQLPLFRPLTQANLERRLAFAVLHYTFYRPHQGLGGSTPAEALFGWPVAASCAVPPPRAAPGIPSPAPPFAIAFLDPDARHPILAKGA